MAPPLKHAVNKRYPIAGEWSGLSVWLEYATDSRHTEKAGRLSPASGSVGLPAQERRNFEMIVFLNAALLR